MGTRITHYCDVFRFARQNLKTYEVTIQRLGDPDLLNLGGTSEIVFTRRLVMCPRALARALQFIERATKPPSGKSEATAVETEDPE